MVQLCFFASIIPTKLVEFNTWSRILMKRNRINKGIMMFKKLFTGCVLVLIMTWALSDVSDLQAGKTYYYDAKGNLISEEEYRKIVDPKAEPGKEPPREKVSDQHNQEAKEDKS